MPAGLLNDDRLGRALEAFQTTGVVAFARGCPLYGLQAGRLDVMGHRVSVHEEYRLNAVAAMDNLTAKL